jgi:hypothetical protein
MNKNELRLNIASQNINHKIVYEFEDDYELIDKPFICEEYAPDVFAHLRSLDGKTIEDLK